jgi:Flp pilus assembly protein TadB
MSAALVLLAVAVPMWSRVPAARLRLTWVAGMSTPTTRLRGVLTGGRATRALLFGALGVLVAAVVSGPAGVVAGVGVAAGSWWLSHRIGRGTQRVDALGLAATWDLLAACLRAGLPVPTAVAAIAGDLPAGAASALHRVADLLALGADPVAAWAPALDCPETAGLARGARRTTRSGTALAEVVAELATTVRDGAADAAEARAQRAGVLITAPLGLCFLPAFVCLGIVPVVVGLAGRLAI